MFGRPFDRVSIDILASEENVDGKFGAQLVEGDGEVEGGFTPEVGFGVDGDEGDAEGAFGDRRRRSGRRRGGRFHN
jgi:hypothetical protein